MNDAKKQITGLARAAHELTESTYRAHPAISGDAQWPEKQRVLLADMSLHLLQTALREGEIDQQQLQNNLYAILTICAPFLPDKELGRFADAVIAPA